MKKSELRYIKERQRTRRDVIWKFVKQIYELKTNF